MKKLLPDIPFIIMTGLMLYSLYVVSTTHYSFCISTI